MVVLEDKIRLVCYVFEDVNLFCIEFLLVFFGDIVVVYVIDFVNILQMMSFIFGGFFGIDNCVVDIFVECMFNL